MMETYNSKRQEMIKEYLIKNSNKHISAFDIYEYFSKQNTQIGLTTIYRQLDKLVNDGFVNKYIIDSQSPACFEYIKDDCKCDNCYHMKCEKCGTIIHLECHEVDNISKYLFSDHNFKLDTKRTVFYGLCEKCLN